jgi:hypothetical protein
MRRTRWADPRCGARGDQDDVEFLRANIDMATGRPGDAVKVLQQVHSDESLPGLSRTTSASRCCRTVEPGAIEQLDKAGRLPAR